MSEMTLNEIQKAGIEALVEKLGPVGMARFISLYTVGRGDYTKERQQWKFQKSREQILDELLHDPDP